MKVKLIVVKLLFFTIINVWLLYLICGKIKLEKINIKSAWLDYLMYLLEIDNPTIEFKLFILLCVFFLFVLIFFILIKKLGLSPWIGFSILMIFMSKILYKVENNFLTLGEDIDINVLGVTIEHVMSIKEKLTLLKDYIKTNNIVIDDKAFLLILDVLKTLKKEDEVIKTIEEMVEALKQKEFNIIKYIFSKLTLTNILFVQSVCSSVDYQSFIIFTTIMSVCMACLYCYKKIKSAAIRTDYEDDDTIKIIEGEYGDILTSWLLVKFVFKRLKSYIVGWFK